MDRTENLNSRTFLAYRWRVFYFKLKFYSPAFSSELFEVRVDEFLRGLCNLIKLIELYDILQFLVVSATFYIILYNLKSKVGIQMDNK